MSPKHFDVPLLQELASVKSSFPQTWGRPSVASPPRINIYEFVPVISAGDSVVFPQSRRKAFCKSHLFVMLKRKSLVNIATPDEYTIPWFMQKAFRRDQGIPRWQDPRRNSGA